MKILVTQRSQRRRKGPQKNFKLKLLTKPLGILLFVLCISISNAKNNNKQESSNKFDLAQVIRSIALIYTDDKLDPEVEEFLNYKQKIIWEDNAYVYLWGMDKVTDDPYATGKELLEKLLEEDKVYDYEKHPYEFDFIDEYDYISLPENDLICSKTDLKCVNNALQISKDTKRLTNENNILIERYKTFTQLKHFKLISSLNYENPWPSYRIITISQKVFHLSIIEELRLDSSSIVIDKLTVELNSLKSKLKDADTLISKMIMFALVAENIELFSILNQKQIIQLDESHANTIFNPLSSSELSTYSALFYEHFIGLKMVFDMCIDIERLNEKKFIITSTLPLIRILAFIGVKPNLTANTQYINVIKKLFYLSELPQHEFYQLLELMPIMTQ